MKVIRAVIHLGFAIGLVPLVTACMTRPTIEVTKAPFHASSELTNGTSRAVGDLTEPTKDFTSSTSPGSWFNGDGTLKAEHKVRAFAVFNFDNLKQDIAHGHGEYLTSFATLLSVPADYQAEFFRYAQASYPAVFANEIAPHDSVDRMIRELTNVPVRRLIAYASDVPE